MAVQDAIARAKERGLDGLCITDHNTLDVRHVLSEGVQENGLCVIFGMEYSTATRRLSPFTRIANPNIDQA
jgi:predicted metal-dependent phosphoesterase TrpH